VATALGGSSSNQWLKIPYPGYDDPLSVSLALAKVIHEYATAEDAVRYLAAQRGRDIDFLTKALLPR
jgi:hypothetical protein